MSSDNRDKASDRLATQLAIWAGRGTLADGENWLGHGIYSGAAMIDELLLLREGASRAELDLCMQSPSACVDEHLRHLQTTHGLTVEKINGRWRFKLEPP